MKMVRINSAVRNISINNPWATLTLALQKISAQYQSWFMRANLRPSALATLRGPGVRASIIAAATIPPSSCATNNTTPLVQSMESSFPHSFTIIPYWMHHTRQHKRHRDLHFISYCIQLIVFHREATYCGVKQTSRNAVEDPCVDGKAGAEAERGEEEEGEVFGSGRGVAAQGSLADHDAAEGEEEEHDCAAEFADLPRSVIVLMALGELLSKRSYRCEGHWPVLIRRGKWGDGGVDWGLRYLNVSLSGLILMVFCMENLEDLFLRLSGRPPPSCVGVSDNG